MANAAVRESWAAAPMVFVAVPTCPFCGGLAYKRVRTESGGDGSSTKKVICASCTRKFKIVLELPDSGNVGLDNAIMSAGD